MNISRWEDENPGRNSRGQGASCLVSLNKEIMGKDGFIYRFIQGALWAGYIGQRSDTADAIVSHTAIQIGAHENPNHIVIPMSNVLAIQKCHKVLKIEGILVIT